MKPYLIALDLDGTLLTDQKIITDKTAKLLKKAEDAGHYIMIATGRPYRATEAYYKQLGLTTPVVNFNGAFVHLPGKENLWKPIHTPLPLNVVKEVLEAMQQFPYHNIIAEVLDDVYMDYHDEKLLNIFSFGGPQITVNKLQDYLEDSPTTLLIQSKEEDVNAIRKHLNSIHANVVNHRLWASPWGQVVDVYPRGVNKAVGIDSVAKWLNIPQERIIAFGDETNDLEMIEYAGVGVAMSNAIDELKTIADEVTSASNNEDGITDVLIDRLNL